MVREGARARECDGSFEIEGRSGGYTKLKERRNCNNKEETGIGRKELEGTTNA